MLVAFADTSKCSCAKFVKTAAGLERKLRQVAALQKEISMIRYLVLLAIVAMCGFAARAADQNTRVVIYDGVATEVSSAPEASGDLWITVGDLTRATRFVIKPQGVCRDE